MPNLRIELNTRRPLGLLRSRTVGSEALRQLVNALSSVECGQNQSDGVMWSCNDDTALGNTAFDGPAVAMLVMTGSSGAVGAQIGGVLTTVAWATSDTASQTALAAQIRALATVNRKVTATNVAAKFTIASALAGQYVDAMGTRFTAISTTPANAGEWQRGVSDTADALSLSLAINRHPSTALRYRAVSVLGVVWVFCSTDRSLQPNKLEQVTNPGSFSTITIQNAVPVAGPNLAIIAVNSGDIGNEVRAVASGTNVTIVTAGSVGFLGHGTGGGILPVFLLP
jgi:uncharacterized membrane protein